MSQLNNTNNVKNNTHVIFTEAGLPTSNATLRCQDFITMKVFDMMLFQCIEKESSLYWRWSAAQFNMETINMEAKECLTAHIHLLIENPYSAVDDSAAKNINYNSPFFPKLHRTNNTFPK